MKKLLAVAALATLAAAPAYADGMEAGVSVGPTWAMSGDSPITGDFTEVSFKDDFDTGWSFSGYVAGPMTDMFGWRVEGGWDKMSADADRLGGTIDGDYKLFRLSGGIQISPFRTEGNGHPYAFFTVGLAHEDASFELDGFDIEGDGESAFGMSFGGGYNHLIGESWGLGGDLHINAGFFDSDTRWWWTPSAQIFFHF